jgi:hypothetical protein
MKPIKSLAILLVMLLFVGAIQSMAATFTVSNTNDSGQGSLRDAVIQANALQDVDTIRFDPNVFNVPKTITLTTGQLYPVYSLIIEGPGAESLTISGNNQSRIFFNNFSSSFLNISKIKLVQGYSTNGGAINTSNNLQLDNVVIADNKAESDQPGPSGFRAGLGGGVYSSGTLTLSNSVISNNIASGVVLINTTNPNFGDIGTSGGGGGVFSSNSNATIVNCRFENNVARGINSPAAPDNRSSAGGGYAYGGAIYGLSVLKIINSSFDNNRAIAGNGGSIEIFAISAGNGGDAAGGAIFASGSTLLNLTFKNNSATSGNGGIAQNSNNAGKGGDCLGGGVFDFNLVMTNSTIVNNSCTTGNGRISGNGYGGGVYGQQFSWKMTNNTVTGNSITGGTGIQSNGNIQGGGVFSSSNTGSSSSFRNNIVAENSALQGSDVFGTFFNATNNLIGIGEPTTGITNGVNGNLVGSVSTLLNPMLAAIADNGGLTETRAVLSGSPAINAGNNSAAVNPLSSQTLQFDQRNFERFFPVGGTIDIGAYEFGSTNLPVTGTPDLRSSSDTGLSDIDNLTASTSPVFDVQNTIPGATIELLRNNNVVSALYATTFTANLTDLSPPLDGLVTYSVRQTIGTVVSPVSVGLNVTFDHTPPNFTINQASSQSDPTTTSPIRFTAVFSEPVGGLESGDISLNGSTANVSNAVVFINFVNPTTFDIEISGISSPGNILITIPAGAVYDYVLTPSSAPTYIDNSVLFQPSVIGVSISGRIRRTSSIVKVPSRVTLVDSFTGESWSTQTNYLGYYRFFGTPIYQQIGRRFTVRIDNKSFVYTAPSPVLITGNRINLNFIVP